MDTGARCWLCGHRVRIFNAPHTFGALFRYPVGDGEEWASIFVDLNHDWGSIQAWMMHELLEYIWASKDRRYRPDNIDCTGSDCTLFVFDHTMFSLGVDDAMRAWFTIRKPLKKAWRKWQKGLKHD